MEDCFDALCPSYRKNRPYARSNKKVRRGTWHDNTTFLGLKDCVARQERQPSLAGSLLHDHPFIAVDQNLNLSLQVRLTS
eukprot:1155406-Pelagomonas_calceolata.AAC.1